MTSGRIKVDTDKVVLAATNITRYNQQIKDDFEVPEDAIEALAACWEGVSSENIRGSFFAIKSAYYDERYQRLANCVNFLLRQVDAGYVQVENTNRSLADAFK